MQRSSFRNSVCPCSPITLHILLRPLEYEHLALASYRHAQSDLIRSRGFCFYASIFVSCDATILSSRLPLLLSHSSAASVYPNNYLPFIRLTEILFIMTVRTFTMPKSLNESLASEQPPNSDADRSSLSGVDAKYSASEREPLASHGPKRKPGITYGAQDKLPKLPIPELEDTCRKYQAALAPLQNRREQEDTAAAVQDFLKNDGPELQTRLKKYATGKTSYIEQFCTSYNPFSSFHHHEPLS